MAASDRTAARLIREIRLECGLTQAELARRAGMSRSVVNAYEQGTRQPGVNALARIAAAGGMRVTLDTRNDPIDVSRAGQLLEQVVDLAEALPYRPRRELSFPSLGKPGRLAAI